MHSRVRLGINFGQHGVRADSGRPPYTSVFSEPNKPLHSPPPPLLSEPVERKMTQSVPRYGGGYGQHNGEAVWGDPTPPCYLSALVGSMRFVHGMRAWGFAYPNEPATAPATQQGSVKCRQQSLRPARLRPRPVRTLSSDAALPICRVPKHTSLGS